MIKQRGFTLIELMVFITIGLIFLIMISGAVSSINGSSNISYGINGMLESRCVEGYKFIVTQEGSRQILDEFGKGVRCENPNAGKPGAFGRM